MNKKHTPEFVREKVRQAQKIVKDMQEGRRPKTGYLKAVMELRYWRNRQIQLGGKNARRKD